MKKLTILAFIFTIAATTTFAQSIGDTLLNIGVQSVPGFTVTLDHDAKIVKNVVKQKFKDGRLKSVNKDGYTAVLGQVVPELSGSVPVNLYIGISEKGPKGNKKCVITICAMTMNIADRIPGLNERASLYLKNIVQETNRSVAKSMIAPSEKAEKKATKAHEKAVKELEATNRTIQKEQQKLEALEKDIEKLQAKLDAMRLESEALRTSIENNTARLPELESNVNQSGRTLQQSQTDVQQYRRMATE